MTRAAWPYGLVPAHLTEMIRAAFGDLDTTAAIALLGGMADDDGVPDGAKFETFVYVDRLLGLDLPSDIGKPA